MCGGHQLLRAVWRWHRRQALGLLEWVGWSPVMHGGLDVSGRGSWGGAPRACRRSCVLVYAECRAA
jgi:hypothetical protein